MALLLHCGMAFGLSFDVFLLMDIVLEGRPGQGPQINSIEQMLLFTSPQLLSLLAQWLSQFSVLQTHNS